MGLMKLLRLFWRLLRYRVAVMLILFMLLAAAIHGTLGLHPWQFGIAAVALALSYVSATSSNDLADRKIDAVNHPTSYGRPLITGGAQPKDMWLLFGVASAGSVGLASLLGYRVGEVLALSILINILYSLPPARLSYRTFLAPLVLGVAYVGIPYLLALTVGRSDFDRQDTGWLAGLYLMFVGRIILKDFRDRTGDAKYHKPTFLLRFGKEATCIVSLTGLSIGGLLLVLQTRHTLWLATIVLLYLFSIAIMLGGLLQAPVGRHEQLYIGVGARMGNGLLITLLTALLLRSSGALAPTQLVVTAAVASLFFGNYISFLRHPEAATIGYKG